MKIIREWAFNSIHDMALAVIKLFLVLKVLLSLIQRRQLRRKITVYQTL